MDRKKLVFLKDRMERIMMDGNGDVAWEKYLRDKIVELLEILIERETPTKLIEAFSPEMKELMRQYAEEMGMTEKIILKGPKPEDINYLWRNYFITLIQEGLKGLREHNL